MAFTLPPWRILGARGDPLRCHPDPGSRADESLPPGWPRRSRHPPGCGERAPWAAGHGVTGMHRPVQLADDSPSLLRAVGRSRSAHIWMIGVCQPDPVDPALVYAYSIRNSASESSAHPQRLPPVRGQRASIAVRGGCAVMLEEGLLRRVSGGSARVLA